MLWRVTSYFLAPYARLDTPGHTFYLERDPFPTSSDPHPVNPGPYRMGKNVEDANIYRVGHVIAQQVLQACCALPTPRVELRFNLSGSGKRIAVLDSLAVRSGWLTCTRFTLNGFETEDHILLAGVLDDGQQLEPTAWTTASSLSQLRANGCSIWTERQDYLFCSKPWPPQRQTNSKGSSVILKSATENGLILRSTN